MYNESYLLSGGADTTNRRAFFGFRRDDIRGQGASAWILPKGSVTTPLPNGTEKLNRIITYDGYNTNVKPSGFKDNDISHEFINFLVDTAIFHRTIDKHTGASKKKDFIMDRITLALGDKKLKLSKNLLEEIDNDLLVNPKKMVKESIEDSLINTNYTNDVFSGTEPPFNTPDNKIIFKNAVKNHLKTKTRFDADPKSVNALNAVALNAVRKILEKYMAEDHEFSTKVMKHFYDNVLSKWSSTNFDNKDRSFYSKYMNFVDRSGKSIEFEQASRLSLDDLKSYRVNLKKVDGIPIFARSLPHYDAERHGNVWYTPCGLSDSVDNLAFISKYKVVRLEEPNRFFQHIYKNVYNTDEKEECIDFIMNVDNRLRNESTRTKFNWHTSKLVQKDLAGVKRRVEELDEGVYDDYTIDNFIDRDLWKTDVDGKLYKEVGDKKVYLDDINKSEDELYKHVNWSSDQCGPTLYGDKMNCENFYEKCVKNGKGKLEDCVEYMKNKNAFKVDKEQINKMHPTIVLNTLISLDFKAKDYDDVLEKNKIKVIETVESWLINTVKPRLNDTEFKQISDNTHLLDYLRYFIQFINGNPQILNSHLEKTTFDIEKLVVAPEYSDALGIKHRKDEDIVVRRKGFTELANKLARKNDGRTLQINMRYPQGISHVAQLPVMAQVVGPMYGGGDPVKVRDMAQNKGTRYVATIYQNLMAKLGKDNKRLSSETNNKLQNMIKKMGELEKNIMRSLGYIEAYIELTNLYSGRVTDLQKVLTMNHIQKILRRHEGYFSKYGLLEQDLMSILASAVNNIGCDDDILDGDKNREYITGKRYDIRDHVQYIRGGPEIIGY